MRKAIKLQDLDCAHCAAKIENAIAKLDNITAVNVNVMSQRMILEAPDASFDAVLDTVKRLVKKLEPDVVMEV